MLAFHTITVRVVKCQDIVMGTKGKNFFFFFFGKRMWTPVLTFVTPPALSEQVVLACP